MSTMRITLRRSGACAFEATNEAGARVVVAGSSELEARILERADASRIPSPSTAPAADAPMRPMELFLVSLAGCGAMDVVLILSRQREPLGELTIEVSGRRADATPAVFEQITLRFVAHASDVGAVDTAKLARAAELSVHKYCSVASMLGPDVEVRVETEVR